MSPHEFQFVRTSLGPPIKLFRCYTFSSMEPLTALWRSQFQEQWHTRFKTARFKPKNFVPIIMVFNWTGKKQTCQHILCGHHTYCSMALIQNRPLQQALHFLYNKINYVRQNYLFLLIRKATCFDPSVGHLQTHISVYVISAVCTLGSQYIYINKIHKIR